MLLLSKLKVSGHSMEPSIHYGQQILVSIFPYFLSTPKINDIIAFNEKNTRKIFVKRITGRKGERYFVKGDNTKDSLDSRTLGFIKKSDILGKVIYILK